MTTEATTTYVPAPPTIKLIPSSHNGSYRITNVYTLEFVDSPYNLTSGLDMLRALFRTDIDLDEVLDLVLTAYRLERNTR